ncbi:hypothetical protein LIER_39127 [Lithospermum erythrorhizon]|uniref:Uncharacterized protein n=1 Tax=Lithospermum erythrorhizon TaxID=34254 RepID=A0AAV3QED2_LITER
MSTSIVNDCTNNGSVFRTVHVFNLKVDSGSLNINRARGSFEPSSPTSPASHLSFIKGVLPRILSAMGKELVMVVLHLYCISMETGEYVVEGDMG